MIVSEKNLDCVRDVKKISNAKRIIDAQGKLKIGVYIIMYSKSGGLIYSIYIPECQTSRHLPIKQLVLI